MQADRRTLRAWSCGTYETRAQSNQELLKALTRRHAELADNDATRIGHAPRGHVPQPAAQLAARRMRQHHQAAAHSTDFAQALPYRPHTG